MKKFEELTYLGQVRRLRGLAEVAVRRYRLRSPIVRFINHGENTTYEVRSGTRKYLLRIHRLGYHTSRAIREELRWLKKLEKTASINAQIPIKSKENKTISSCLASGFDQPRNCDLLTWIDGRMRFKDLQPHDLFLVGELTARLHDSADKIQVGHRKYWHPEGLLGADASMGSVVGLKMLTAYQQDVIEAGRKTLLRKLKNYHRFFPEKHSLIHADLHFGNIIWNHGKPNPIDFDDCGYGAHPYDLAVTLSSIERICNFKLNKSFYALKDALIDGYVQHRGLTRKDIEMIEIFLMVRKVVMVGWLHARSDHPNLRNSLKNFVKFHMKTFKKIL